MRGGVYSVNASYLHASYRSATWPSTPAHSYGFRLVLVPEPAVIFMLAVVGVGIIRRKRA